MKTPVYLLPFFLLATGPVSASETDQHRELSQDRQQDSVNEPAFQKVALMRVGGGCTYTTHKGKCTIILVSQTPNSKHQAQVAGGPGYEGYVVRYVFSADKPLPLQASLPKWNELRLVNSWYPGPLYLKKYNIRAGRNFACKVKLIKSGPCAPAIFSFSGINRADYFETKTLRK